MFPILNIRAGIACNSSSSHSLLIPNDPSQISAQLDDIDEGDGALYYGWSNFVETDSAKYFAIMLFKQLRYEIGPAMAKIVLNYILPGVEVHEDSSIDHQSVFSWPKDRFGHFNTEFAMTFLQWAQHNNLIILGGNDNGDGDHPLLGQGSVIDPVGPEGSVSEYIARQDPFNLGLWSIYHPGNGMKLRVWLGEGPAPTRGSPELLDVKVTDHCSFGCQFCYQSSTTEGVHATSTYSSIERYTDAIKELQPLEVALGGGEPTFWPGLDLFRSMLRDEGINVSLTTRNFKWLMTQDPNYWGAAAYSWSSNSKIEEVIHLKERWGDKLVVQFIEKVDQFYSIMRVLGENINVCILGYKTVGFGTTFPTTPWSANMYQQILEKMLEYYSRVRVDTAFLRNNPDFTKEFSDKSYHKSEGAWSAYIDLVKGVVAPSSYSDPPMQLSVDDNWGNLPNLIKDLEIDE